MLICEFCSLVENFVDKILSDFVCSHFKSLNQVIRLFDSIVRLVCNSFILRLQFVRSTLHFTRRRVLQESCSPSVNLISFEPRWIRCSGLVLMHDRWWIISAPSNSRSLEHFSDQNRTFNHRNSLSLVIFVYFRKEQHYFKAVLSPGYIAAYIAKLVLCTVSWYHGLLASKLATFF